MTGSALTRWTLHVRAGGCDRGGSLREGSGWPILLGRRLADDGKRSPALDVAFRAGGSSEGRESEGGEWVSDFAGWNTWRIFRFGVLLG